MWITKNLKPSLKIITATLVISLLWLGYTPNLPRELLTEKYTNSQSKFISNDRGLRVHFRDEGVIGGQSIVLLHGNSNSLHMFEPLVKNLIDDYRVISLDFPGHGLTGAHPENKYGYKELSEALELVVSHLSLENYTLLGHSMGGWVAWRHAAEKPTELRSLVLMSASGMPRRPNDPNKNGGLGFKLLKSPIGPLLTIYTLPRAIIKKSTEQSVYNKDVATDELIDTFWELLREPENRKALFHRSKAGREIGKADLARSIDVPTLLIWGDQDSFVYPSASISFSERIKDTQTILLSNIGHMPMLESTESVADGIRNFLANK